MRYWFEYGKIKSFFFVFISSLRNAQYSVSVRACNFMFSNVTIICWKMKKKTTWKKQQNCSVWFGFVQLFLKLTNIISRINFMEYTTKSKLMISFYRNSRCGPLLQSCTGFFWCWCLNTILKLINYIHSHQFKC